jgi:hypothetical protein
VPQATPDEIDSFVKGFDAFRLNGVWPEIDLPADAPPEKVVEALAQIEKKNNQFRGYRIIETKKIAQPASPLNGDTVVLIASGTGSKTIILLRFFTRWSAHPFYITTVP